MKKIYKSLSDLIGNTPILEAESFVKENDLQTKILTKLEYFNPTGSIKDRIAKAMIEEGIQSGKITAQTTIIEPTSGNTGIGLAAIATSLNLPIIITMPETMSIERRKLLQGYGATLELTSGSEGMKGAIARAKQLHQEIENSFIPSQFENTENPKVHYATTGPEIYQQTDGNIDVLIAGVGTGGTISGVGKYLKEKIPTIEIIAVEPSASPVLSKGQAGPHKIQGIGAGFIPDTLDTTIYDQIITVDNEDAFITAKQFAKTQGILVGISSGAALHAAKVISLDKKYYGKTIVVILPDGGDRYLSTDLF